MDLDDAAGLIGDASPQRAAFHSPDPVSEAVAFGLQRQGPSELSLRRALSEARDLLVQARRDRAFRASLPRVLALVQGHPHAEDLQITAARLILENGDSRAFTCWSEVHRRFPRAPEPFRILVRLTLRQAGETAAQALVDGRFPDLDLIADEPDLLAYAFAQQELGSAAQAEAAFQRTTQLFPQSRIAWRQLVALQEARGALLSARHSAAEAAGQCDGEAFRTTHARLRRSIQALEQFAPNTTAEDSPVSVKSLGALLSRVVSQRHAALIQPRRHLGSTLMITGSLGSGGAERQLIATVLLLNRAIGEGRAIAGYDMAGPVAVACRSLAAKHDNDFFLDTLAREGVPVTEYVRLAAFGGNAKLARTHRVRPLLEFLPVRMKEGVAQLVEFIRYEAPDVVNIWQEGMVFAAGLAALIAGAPRIVLSVRTLPPTDRINRWRLELEPVYRALLSSPGVVMTANSQFVARRYEGWLGMERGDVPVIPNGVSALPEAPEDVDRAHWEAFAQRTADADFTVGAVMRLDQNKRPLEWLRVAERLHAGHPRARFVVVGNGALNAEAREYAVRLGIADRVLFAGRSSAVGYWLGNMDVLMLLSRYEGMPNVLIEAQLAGVPVITTPAGGAAEAVSPDAAGFVLSSAEAPDIEQAASLLMDLAALGPEGRRRLGATARVWAERSFAVEAMLERTVGVFMDPSDRPMLASGQ